MCNQFEGSGKKWTYVRWVETKDYSYYSQVDVDGKGLGKDRAGEETENFWLSWWYLKISKKKHLNFWKHKNIKI